MERLPAAVLNALMLTKCVHVSRCQKVLLFLRAEVWPMGNLLRKLFAVFSRVPSEPRSIYEPLKRFCKFSAQMYVTILLLFIRVRAIPLLSWVYFHFIFQCLPLSLASICRSVCLCASLSDSPHVSASKISSMFLPIWLYDLYVCDDGILMKLSQFWILSIFVSFI
jgi:hypothetical protein